MCNLKGRLTADAAIELEAHVSYWDYWEWWNLFEVQLFVDVVRCGEILAAEVALNHRCLLD